MRIRSHSKGSLVVSGILFLSCAIVLPGCMRPAKFPRRVSVADILDNLTREFCEYVDQQGKNYDWFLDWTASYSLNLIVDRDRFARTDNTNYVVPITTGTRTLGLTARLNKRAYQSMAIDGEFATIRNAQDTKCPQYEPDYRRRLLAGDLGLNEWLQQVVPDLQEGTAAKQIVYTMRFVITKEGSIRPSWVSTYTNGNMFLPNFTLGANGDRTHELKITLVKPKAVEKKIEDLTVITDEKTGNILQRHVIVKIVKEFPKPPSEEEKKQAQKRIKEINETLSIVRNRIAKETISKIPALSSETIAEVKKKGAYKQSLAADSEYESLSKELSDKNKILKAPSVSNETIILPSSRALIQDQHDKALTRSIIRDSFRDR